eukprot:TRINITY_DN5048_c0_g1_i4.p1 TRINITY_DN5048_c0_g1~~TRINITY_DN5048_c0_g1_i4.p1  ORF type:complete len:665 (-),score=72.92 TRINITY_DN5048_c0_g1_i4:61-2055(-)
MLPDIIEHDSERSDSAELSVTHLEATTSLHPYDKREIRELKDFMKEKFHNAPYVFPHHTKTPKAVEKQAKLSDTDLETKVSLSDKLAQGQQIGEFNNAIVETLNNSVDYPHSKAARSPSLSEQPQKNFVDTHIGNNTDCAAKDFVIETTNEDARRDAVEGLVSGRSAEKRTIHSKKSKYNNKTKKKTADSVFDILKWIGVMIFGHCVCSTLAYISATELKTTVLRRFLKFPAQGLAQAMVLIFMLRRVNDARICTYSQNAKVVQRHRVPGGKVSYNPAIFATDTLLGYGGGMFLSYMFSEEILPRRIYELIGLGVFIFACSILVCMFEYKPTIPKTTEEGGDSEFVDQVFSMAAFDAPNSMPSNRADTIQHKQTMTGRKVVEEYTKIAAKRLNFDQETGPIDDETEQAIIERYLKKYIVKNLRYRRIMGTHFIFVIMNLQAIAAMTYAKVLQDHTKGEHLFFVVFAFTYPLVVGAFKEACYWVDRRYEMGYGDTIETISMFFAAIPCRYVLLVEQDISDGLLFLALKFVFKVGCYLLHSVYIMNVRFMLHSLGVLVRLCEKPTKQELQQDTGLAADRLVYRFFMLQLSDLLAPMSFAVYTIVGYSVFEAEKLIGLAEIHNTDWPQLVIIDFVSEIVVLIIGIIFVRRLKYIQGGSIVDLSLIHI